MISPRVIELPSRLEPVSDDTFLDGLSERGPLSVPPTMLGTPRLGRAMVATIAGVAFAVIAAPAGAVTSRARLRPAHAVSVFDLDLQGLQDQYTNDCGVMSPLPWRERSGRIAKRIRSAPKRIHRFDGARSKGACRTTTRI